jgi:hypothetical protein
MAQEYKPGQIVPQSGVYKITRDPVHADMPHEVTVIKGRRFPTCRHCKGITLRASPCGEACRPDRPSPGGACPGRIILCHSQWRGICGQLVSSPVQREPRTARIGRLRTWPCRLRGPRSMIRSVEISALKSHAKHLALSGSIGSARSCTPARIDPGGPQEMVLKASERRRQLWSGSQVRSGLAAGGKGIRTIGPRERISVFRKPPRPPSPPGEAVSPKNLPFLVQA